MAVVLPAPFGPKKPKISPGSTRREKRSSALTHWLLKKPRYCLLMLLNSRAGTLSICDSRITPGLSAISTRPALPFRQLGTGWILGRNRGQQKRKAFAEAKAGSEFLVVTCV